MYVAEIRNIGSSDLAIELGADKAVLTRESLEDLLEDIEDYIEGGYAVTVYNSDFMPTVSEADVAKYVRD